MYPPVRTPLPFWDLNVVQAQTASPPFELREAAGFYLSVKPVVSIAITSARHRSGLHVLMAELPVTGFHKDKVLRTHLKFSPGIISGFHMSELIMLPVLSPKPHTRDGEANARR